MGCCLRKITGLLVTLAIIIVVLAGAFYLLVLPQIDVILADAVRREFMLPPSSTVIIEHGSLVDTYQGQVDSFLVESNEAKLEGLVIEDVRLVANGIQFDLPRTLITGNAELSKVNHARLSFRVSEEALEQRWSKTLARRGISDVEVNLTENDIQVSGMVDLKLTQVKVSARGNFEVDNRKIRMAAKELDVGGAKLGLGEFEQFFSKTIKAPLLDLGELKMGINIRKLESRNGYLYIDAETQGLAELAKAMKEQTEERAEKLADDKGESTGQQLEDKLKDAGKTVEDLGKQLKDKIF